MPHALTADPWESDIFDVESINAETSDHILREIGRISEETRDWARTPRASATLVLGPAGAGKTHLFARLRAKLGLTACFVHVRPLFGIVPSQRLVLAAILEALATRVAPNGLAQIDLLAGAVLARASGLPRNMPNVALDDLRDAPDRQARLARAAELVERNVRGLHGPTLRHLLRLPFSDGLERQARLRYLEGEDLTEEEGTALGMKTGLAVRLSDMDVSRAVTTLARLASIGTPLVVAFDQLENLDTGDDTSRVIAFGHLVAELHDTASGMVLVLLALDDLWRHRVAPALPEAVRARIGRASKTLRNPTAVEKDALLQGWRQQLPELGGTTFPAPFSVDAWATWRAETSATPRVLLEELDAWCDGRRGASPGAESAAGVDADASIDEDLTRRIGAAHDEVRRTGAAHPIAVGRLRAALDQVLRLAGSRVEGGASPDELVAERGGARRRVVVAQHTNHTSLGAALKRALSDDVGLAVREGRVPLRASWKVCRQQQEELATRSRWVELDPDDVAWAMGVHDLMAAGRSGEVVDDRGRAVDASRVAARCEQLVGDSAVVRRLRQDPPRPPATSPEVAASPTRTGRSKTERPVAAQTRRSASGEVLERLGVASVDRILRELRVSVPEASRALVLEQLTTDATVTFLGPSVVARKAFRR